MKKTRSTKINVQAHLEPRLVASVVKRLKEEGVVHKGSYAKVVRSAFLILLKDSDFFLEKEEAADFLEDEGFSLVQLGRSVDGELEMNLRGF